MNKEVGRLAANTVSGIRKYHKNKVKRFAKDIKNKKILEIGSGIKRDGYYYYSMHQFFDSSNKFQQTDVNPAFGHKVLDITKMKYKDDFDILLCLNVLEHVYDFRKAIDNIHNALKQGGVVVIAVPTFYPLHDEPGDYWRFTEHALRKMFADFSSISIEYKGVRQYPYTYYLEATK